MRFVLKCTAVLALAGLASLVAWSQEGSGTKPPHKEPGGATIALKGNCPVCLIEMGKEVPGEPGLASTRDGLAYRFEVDSHKKMFDADPAKYAAVRRGGCVVCAARGMEQKGDPAIYAVHDKRIYLFVDTKLRDEFVHGPSEFVDAKGNVKKQTERVREGS